MAKYRHDLPQRRGGIFLTDGGMETTLIFHEGVELPHFAAFVLLDSPEGRLKLKQYYEAYLAIARDHGVGFVLDSPTWRANPDWADKLGYDAAALKAINMSFDRVPGRAARRAGRRPNAPCVISGAIGPRGDGYKAGNMDAAEAEAYHARADCRVRRSGADMVTAFTLTSIRRSDRHRACGQGAADSRRDFVHGGNRRPPGQRRNVARRHRNGGSRDRQALPNIS